MTRKCRKCGETKLLDEFYKDKSKSLGHGSICKVCGRIERHEYFLSHKEEVYKSIKANYHRYRPRHLKRCAEYHTEHLYNINNEKRNTEILLYHIKRRVVTKIHKTLRNYSKPKCVFDLL